MGTGFVIHQDRYGSYLLTCAHVVEQVVTPMINGVEVEIKALGASETIDLALLYVKGMFKTPLQLQKRVCSSDKVELIGYSHFTRDKYQIKSRKAKILGKKIGLQGISDETYLEAWQIVAEDHVEIEHGNSGGPLICEETGKVIGVVSNNRGVEQGFALSIEHLKDIWEEIPPFLFESDSGDESPFVGLSAFGIEQSHLFFGRDREIGEIIKQLKEGNLVAVVGDSGSGKSSVIKAGVIPKYLNGVLASTQEFDATFHLIDTRPAENPFNELSNSINEITKAFNLDFETTNQLKKAIKSKNHEDILNALEYIFKEESANLLLYIDQFEELFTLCDEVLQKEFIELLLYLLENQTSQLKIKIILTIRRDYYNLISEYPPFFEKTQAYKYTLRRMKNEQIQECIERPLERTFIAKDKITPFAKAVLHDMGDESSELALLQIALTQTWKHKEDFDNNLLVTYHQIGEVSGALSKLADDTWRILNPIEQKILQYIFIRIIKTNDTGGVIRRLANQEEFSQERWGLAQKLASALDSHGNVASEKNARLGRLLTIKGEEGKVVELTHEALIRQWPMYQKWLKEVSKNNLKRIHDTVIEKSKIYQNHQESKFLLMGYDLEESLRLLDNDYIAYLSKTEVAYIKKSQKQKQITRWMKVGVALFVMLLLGVITLLIKFNEPSVSVSIKRLNQRIESSERDRYERDNLYADFVVPKARDDKKEHSELIKLISLSPTIAYGAEKNYWLKRLTLMTEDTKGKLFKILQFEAYVSKGNSLFVRAKYKEAIDAYREADKINSEDYLYMYMGNSYFAMRNTTQALFYYKKILEKNPKSESAHFNIANTYNMMQQYDDAIVEFKNVLEINPKSEVAYTGMGIAYNYKQEYVFAIEAFKEVLAINPKNDNAYYSIGLAYGFRMLYDDAIENTKKAVALNPKNEYAYVYLGNSYLFLKKYNKAIDAFKEVIKINPQNYLVYTVIFGTEVFQNQEIDSLLEAQYIKFFEPYKNIFIEYEMIKTFQKIVKKESVDLEEWEEKYRGIPMPLNFNFYFFDDWIESIVDQDSKEKLLEASEFFKQHR